jgi:ABC-type glycerol-3-phosphate transport system permease component
VDFSRKLLNSLIVSGIVAVLGVLLSVLNAYALGIGRVKGRVWFPTSASGLIGILPALLFFLIFQRTLTRGITAGAIK